MMRVLLISPPSPERLGAPLLGLQYVAASLLAHGCDVRVVDAAACCFPHDEAWILRQAEEFAPEIVGFGLNTRWVRHAYRLAEAFQGRFPLLVAGGPHATACPDETLWHGFDAAVTGEAEEALVHLVDAVGRREPVESVPGIRCRAPDGSIRTGASRMAIADLDALPFPQDAHALFDPTWYRPEGGTPFAGGILTSRGCPARCSFCANYVTGRRVRHRSPQNVAAELNACHARFGTTFFSFWDDALTADPHRLLALCGALEREVTFPLQWSAITRASMVTPELLRAMRRAGLVAVNFGVESGDDAILRAIGKGITTAQVLRALEWAREEGLQTICNFMLGFPEETPQALERTLGFMERIAPLVDSFSTLGVIVPFPGTPLYDRTHAHYGFTDWWLREDHSRHTPLPPLDDVERFRRSYADDPNLDLDFFRYTDEVREAIRECLRFKAEHNLRRMGLLGESGPRGAGETLPAASGMDGAEP